MPALPAVPKVVRIDLNFSYMGNARLKDHIFLQYSGAMSNTDLATVLTTVANAWAANMSQYQVPGAILNQLEGTDLSGSSAAQQFLTTSKAGTATGTDTPLGLAAVFKFKIPRRYRGGHPRFYLGGLSSNFVGTSNQFGGTIVSGGAASFQAFITAAVLAPPAAVGTLAHVNVSYFQGFTNITINGRAHARPSLRAVPAVDAVISYSLNTTFASQRRRNLQSV